MPSLPFSNSFVPPSLLLLFCNLFYPPSRCFPLRSVFRTTICYSVPLLLPRPSPSRTVPFRPIPLCFASGVPLDSPRFYGQNPAGPWGVAGGRDGAAAATGHSGRHHHRGVGVENGQSAENEQSARGHKSTEEAFEGKEGEGGQGEQVRERRAGPREPRRVLALGEGRENGERGNADGDDDLDLGRDLERDRSSQQGFPLFSPPRVGGGLGGDRMSPPAASLTPSTLQLGLLNSVSPSMLLGPGAGAWLGGATGGIGSGGMSAAAGPSFVQTSQLAPLLLSQMNPHGSFGEGRDCLFSGFARGHCQK